MSSATQTEDLDNFCQFIGQQLQNKVECTRRVISPHRLHASPHTAGWFSAQFGAVHPPAEYLFRAGDLHLKVFV
jgi:hypothetical protein